MPTSSCLEATCRTIWTTSGHVFCVQSLKSKIQTVPNMVEQQSCHKGRQLKVEDRKSNTKRRVLFPRLHVRRQMRAAGPGCCNRPLRLPAGQPQSPELSVGWGDWSSNTSVEPSQPHAWCFVGMHCKPFMSTNKQRNKDTTNKDLHKQRSTSYIQRKKKTTRPRLAQKHNIASEVGPTLQNAFFFPPRSICEASARQHQARCSALTGRCKLVCASCSTQVALCKLLCASCSAQVAPASWSLQVAPCKLLCANCAPCKLLLLCASCSVQVALRELLCASCSRQGALNWSVQVGLRKLLCATCSAQVALRKLL